MSEFQMSDGNPSESQPQMYQQQQQTPQQMQPQTQYSDQSFQQQSPYAEQPWAAGTNPSQQSAQPVATPVEFVIEEEPEPRKKKKGGSGTLKTFFVAFLGAALACILVLVGYRCFFAPKSVVDSVLGGDSSTTIAVNGEDTTLAEAVAAKCTPSVCCIYVYTEQTSSGYYGFGIGSGSRSEGGTLTQSSLGSGVVISEDGYVLTNYHVIEGAAALKVSAGGAEYDAKVIGTDESSDLAVIKLENASGLTPMDIGDSEALVSGEWVMSIGSPFGLESSVATGIVSATSRSQVYSSSTYGSADVTVYVNMIQTDAAINPGNSGGALVNAKGQLIGINTLISSYSGNYSGVGFAIPVNYAYQIAQQLINGETVSHAQLGVTLVSITADLAKRYNLPVETGAYLSSIVTGGAAEKAGLEVGDIIVKFGDSAITSSTELMIAVRQHNVGDTVSVTYYRDDKELQVDVTLGSDTDAGGLSLLQNTFGSSNGSAS